MKEKQIIFSTPEVQEILAERKTQTRRVMKPQPSDGWIPHSFGEVHKMKDGEFILKHDEPVIIGWGPINADGSEAYKCQYHVGDVLWVRETFYELYETRRNSDGEPEHWRLGEFAYVANGDAPTEGRWEKRPSIHMPRAAARIFLRVTDVRAERLQEISEADAIAEGVTKSFDRLSKEEYERWARNVGERLSQDEQPYTNYLWHGLHGSYGMGNKQSDAWSYQYSGYDSAKDSFSSLWELINAKRGYGWDTNPWVFVYTFKVLEDYFSD